MKKALILPSLLLAYSASAQNSHTDSVNTFSNRPDNTLKEVEITATSVTNKSILYQPASIAKIGLQELKRGTGIFLDDAVNTNIPGVFMERRSVSAGQQFNIRGYGNGLGPRGANNNFDGQGPKIYLNGIPVTDAEGISLLDDIDFGSVGNVEIIKGPAGTLYGLAIAGVVNLSTIQPEKNKTSVGQDVMIGSYGLQRYTTRLQVGGERASLLVNYGYQQSDGYMAHTQSRKKFASVTGNFQPNARQTISTYVGYSNSYDERGGELTIDQYNKSDYSGNPAYIKNNAHSGIMSFRGGVSHTYIINSYLANTTTLFASGVSNNSSSAAGWTDKAPINYGLRSTLDAHFTAGKRFRLSSITGVETQRQYAQIIGYAMVADSNNLAGYNRIGAMRSNQLTETGTTSVFTEWTLAMPHDLSVTAGIGLSTMHITLNDRFYVATSKNPASYTTDYNGMVSPHIAVNKVFSRQVSAYVSYSRGYRAPVSGNIFIATTGELNTGLKPESGNQFEIGSKGSLLHSRLSYQLALFNTRFRDKMTAIAVPLNGNTTAYTYVANGGGQNNTGLELAAKYTAYQADHGAFRNVSPFVNFTYSDFKYEDYSYQSLDVNKKPVIADYSGKAVAGVSPVTANAGIDLAAAYGLYGNVTYSYRDAMPISSDGANKTSAFSLLNARIGIQQTLFKRLSLDLFAGANNITGTQYYYMVFINQLPDAYLPAPDKINYFGGINLKYTF